MSRKAKKVTIQQIADHLGLSKFSVSKALAGQGGVSQETRDQVLAAARQLGYPLKPALPAALTEGIVMLVMPRLAAVDTSFWPHILLGVQEALRTYGAGLAMATISEEEQELHIIPTSLQQLQVAGILCLGPLRSTYVARIRDLGYPVVLADNYLPELEVDSIMADDYAGMRAAVQHLVIMGHRRIGFIGNNFWAPSFHRRWLGFRDTLEEYGLRIRPEWSILLSDPEAPPWGPTFPTDRLRELEDFPEAWACVNDRAAHRLMRTLGEMGLRVPDDISVVGFDDIEESAQSMPPLTTVRVYKEAMGVRAVQRLYSRIAAPDMPPDNTLISTRLFVRDSVRAL